MRTVGIDMFCFVFWEILAELLPNNDTSGSLLCKHLNMFNRVAQRPCQETNALSQGDLGAWLIAKMGLGREL